MKTVPLASVSNATGIGNPPGGNFTLRALEPESVPAGYESMTDPVTGQTLIFEDVDWQDGGLQGYPYG